MSNYSQLLRQQRDQTKQKVQNAREEIQKQIDDNRNSKILNKINQVKSESKKKCQFCDQEGIQEDILKHMKNSHKEDFLAMGENSNKCSKCEVCKKLLIQQNIEEHQLLCAIKEDNKKASREANKVRNLKRRNQSCQEISNKEQQEKHKNLLKEFGIDTEINRNHIIQSQESNSNESELITSILNSGIFKTKKKIKTNEEMEENELTLQTLKKIPLKQPTQNQNKSFINFMGELSLNNEDQEKGQRTKKKQHSQ